MSTLGNCNIPSGCGFCTRIYLNAAQISNTSKHMDQGKSPNISRLKLQRPLFWASRDKCLEYATRRRVTWHFKRLFCLTRCGFGVDQTVHHKVFVSRPC